MRGLFRRHSDLPRIRFWADQRAQWSVAVVVFNGFMHGLEGIILAGVNELVLNLMEGK